jgi:hypothetical protein
MNQRMYYAKAVICGVAALWMMLGGLALEVFIRILI